MDWTPRGEPSYAKSPPGPSVATSLFVVLADDLCRFVTELGSQHGELTSRTRPFGLEPIKASRLLYDRFLSASRRSPSGTQLFHVLAKDAPTGSPRCGTEEADDWESDRRLALLLLGFFHFRPLHFDLELLLELEARGVLALGDAFHRKLEIASL